MTQLVMALNAAFLAIRGATVPLGVLLTVLLAPGLGWAEPNVKQLPEGGGEAGKDLMAFLQAAHRKDFAKIRTFYGDEAKEATDKQLEAGLWLYSQFDPAKLTITGGTASGDLATLDTSHGTITMRRTHGRWLLQRWSAHAEETASVSVQAVAKLGEVKPSDKEPAAPGDFVEKDDASKGSSPVEGREFPMKTAFKFDPRTLNVRPEEEKGGEVVVITTSGKEKVLFHNSVDYQEAARVAAILKFYGVNELLEVSMPGVVEFIHLKSGHVLTGKYKGEECKAFDPTALAVSEFKGTYQSEGRDVTYTQWKVADAHQMVVQVNEKPLAVEMASIIRKYRLTHRCRAGGFWYFRS